MLEQQTANILQMGDNARIVAMCAVVVLAYLADFLCCKLLVPLIRRVARRTAFKWDNYLAEGKSLNYVFHLIPPLVFLVVIPLLFPDPASWKRLLLKGIYIYFIIMACRLVCEFISSIYVISSETEALRNKPLKGLYQMFKVLVVCIGAILVTGVLVDKDFTALIAGLGASAAVLMLIFKDTILGVVAGVQLSAYDMLRPGDWIVMDKYGVNGEVEEVNMNTVKVRNWDKTITTIPPYLLVSDSFTNWRGMRESGGRRVARSLRIDMNSVRFCTPAELEHFADYMQQMLPSLCRADELLHLVGEEQGAYLVVVENRTVAEYRRNFREQLALGLHAGSELSRAADIHEQHHREFPLLLEHLYVRRAQPGRDIPVHGPHVVAPPVLPDFAEGHTTPLEGRMVLSRKDLPGQGLRPYLDLADLGKQVRSTVTGR